VSRNMGGRYGGDRGERSELAGLHWHRLDAGRRGAIPHCHSAEEEIFLILEGDGALLLGEDETPLGPGNVVARPPGTGVAHALRAGEGGLVYLAYGTREPNDVCWYPRSRKIFWRGVGVIGRIEQLEYWDGEEPD